MADLKEIPGGGNVDEIAEAIRNMKKNLPQMQEYYEIVARMTRLKYDELIKEGFSESEAVELCKQLF
jgi:hypothetical protein